MKNGNRFLLIFSTLIIIIFITGYFLYRGNTLSYPDWKAYVYGIILTTFNFYAGIILFRTALISNKSRFTGIVLGGMSARLVLMLAAVYISLKFLQIKADVFIFVIFGFYTFYLVAEIFYFYLLRERTK